MDVNPLTGLPRKQALYDPQFERDACGVGFVVNIDGIRSQKVSLSRSSTAALSTKPRDGFQK